jgi:hypothetical protein
MMGNEINNSNHALIGNYVFYNKQKCLVTGAQKRIDKELSETNIKFRLWPLSGGDEYWTGERPQFDLVLKRELSQNTEWDN